MKKQLLALLLSTTCIAFGQDSLQNNWKEYTSGNFSINYPSDWELNTSGQMNTTYILYSKLDSNEDTFRENVNLSIQNLKDMNLDLDAYVALSEKQIKGMINVNAKIIKSERIPKKIREKHLFIWEGYINGFNLKFKQYFFIENEKAYVLTFTAETASFDAYKEIGTKILNSFKRIDS